MIQDILIPFLAIGLAELGDKTQLAVFCLASKTKKYLQLLLGVTLAFIIADGLAILLGDFIAKIIPIIYVKIGAGIIFIIIGVIMLINYKKEEKKYKLKTPFLSGFGLVLISEMGDKTQLASGLFATKFNPAFVFIGVIAALVVLSLIAIYLGRFIMEKVNKKTVSIIAGILFILIGIASFF